MKKDRGGCVRKERGETAMHLKEKKGVMWRERKDTAVR